MCFVKRVWCGSALVEARGYAPGVLLHAYLGRSVSLTLNNLTQSYVKKYLLKFNWTAVWTPHRQTSRQKPSLKPADPAILIPAFIMTLPSYHLLLPTCCGLQFQLCAITLCKGTGREIALAQWLGQANS